MIVYHEKIKIKATPKKTGELQKLKIQFLL